MKICVINDSQLPEKIEPCEVVILLKNPIPLSVKSSVVRSEIWLVRDLYYWINNLPCSNCIGSYFEFSDIDSTILDRIYKLTKFRFDIIQNQEFNIITDNEVCKLWIGDSFKDIPKNCDLVIVNDEPDEKTLTQTRKKTNGNVELANVLKKTQPQNVIYPGKDNSKLESKKNCITKFATIANIMYIDI